MTAHNTETSLLIHARVAGLCAPQVIKTSNRFKRLYFIHKGDD